METRIQSTITRPLAPSDCDFRRFLADCTALLFRLMRSCMFKTQVGIAVGSRRSFGFTINRVAVGGYDMQGDCTEYMPEV